MTTIEEIDRLHIHIDPSERSLSRSFVSSIYKKYGHARNAIRDLMNLAGYNTLSTLEKEICGRWNLLDDAEMDNLFGAEEKEDIHAMFDKYTATFIFNEKNQLDSVGDIISSISGATDYISIMSFVYKGLLYSDIYSIKFSGYLKSAGEYSVRIVDMTNAAIICESTGNTNTTPSIVDFNAITNIPSNDSIFEVHVKRNSANDSGIVINSVIMLAVV